MFVPVHYSGAVGIGCPRREQEAGVGWVLTLSPRLSHVVVVLRAWSWQSPSAQRPGRLLVALRSGQAPPPPLPAA